MALGSVFGLGAGLYDDTSVSFSGVLLGWFFCPARPRYHYLLFFWPLGRGEDVTGCDTYGAPLLVYSNASYGVELELRERVIFLFVRMLFNGCVVLFMVLLLIFGSRSVLPTIHGLSWLARF